MKQATARFRRPANGGVRRGRARSAARLLMFVLLLAALVLLTLAVFYYTRNTAQAMEADVYKRQPYPRPRAYRRPTCLAKGAQLCYNVKNNRYGGNRIWSF